MVDRKGVQNIKGHLLSWWESRVKAAPPSITIIMLLFVAAIAGNWYQIQRQTELILKNQSIIISLDQEQIKYTGELRVLIEHLTIADRQRQQLIKDSIRLESDINKLSSMIEDLDDRLAIIQRGVVNKNHRN